MTFPVVYQSATSVAPGPTPGAKALMAWILANYPPAVNLGIYNPRSVRGGTALSLHAEGRALDIGYPIDRPSGHPVGSALCHALVEHHAALGVQCVIFARRIWTNTRPTWRPYTGTADHFDHAHVELTRAAAAGLTTDIIRTTLGASMPTELSNTERELIRTLQGWLIDNGADLGPSKADGILGRLTLNAAQTIIDHRNQLLRQVELLTIARDNALARLEQTADEARANLAALGSALGADNVAQAVTEIRAALDRLDP